MDQNRLTEDDIEKMSYTDFIALLDETNRCPGGKKTIRRIREIIHINDETNILDVGSNTGFTSLELARITPAKISGIDISESCVDQAKKSLSEDIESVRSRVTFQVASSYSIPFSDDNFDLIMAGGATGFMDDKSKAIHEYLRVLKPWGFLVMSPLTYHTQPPQKIVDDVSEIIGTTIKPMTTKDWINIVDEISKDFEFYFSEPHKLSPRTSEEIDEYVDYFLKKDHIKILSESGKDAIKRRWLSILKVFNENHKYLGYSIIVFRKRPVVEEPELFIST
ncbi:MAG: class I SAM-dependent methyltransferase [Minisyncoccota bacterium]